MNIKKNELKEKLNKAINSSYAETIAMEADILINSRKTTNPDIQNAHNIAFPNHDISFADHVNSFDTIEQKMGVISGVKGKLFEIKVKGHLDNEFIRSPKRVLSGLIKKSRIVAVAAGKRFTLCATDTGKVFSWGAGTLGQLGHPEKKRQSEPKIIIALSGHTITQITCGNEHSLALSDKGKMFSWGYSQNGCTGIGKTIFH